MVAAYGMTEMTALICSHAKHEDVVKLRGSCGKLEAGVEARIVDPNSGKSSFASTKHPFISRMPLLILVQVWMSQWELKGSFWFAVATGAWDTTSKKRRPD